MSGRADIDRRAFIEANTQVLAPPHLPEVKIRVATEAHDLWLKTEEELAEIGLAPPFWAFAWAGGQGLARYLLDHPEKVRGRRVLDFATGSGLVAIAAAKAGAAHVVACDIDPFCREAVALNAALNGICVEMRLGDPIGGPIEADVILAGDVFYDRDFAARLVPWFDSLAAQGRTIVVGDPGRAYLPRERLERLGDYRVPTTRALEDSEIKHTVVWRWRTD